MSEGSSELLFWFTRTPLTTIFTPPPSCSTRLFTTDTELYGSVGTVVWDDSVGMDETELPCYPMEWKAAAAWFETLAFSPGVCPADYTTFTTGSIAGATVAYCCPNGFTGTVSFTERRLEGYNVGTQFPICTSPITRPINAVVVTTTYVSSGTDVQILFLPGPTVTATPSVAKAYGIIAAWQSSDLKYFDPESAPVRGLTSYSQSDMPRSVVSLIDPCTGAGAQRIRACATGNTPNSIPNPFTGSFATVAGNSIRTSTAAPSVSWRSSNRDGNGLLRGQLIGIEVGAVCGFVVLLALGSWLIFRRTRRRKTTI